MTDRKRLYEVAAGEEFTTCITQKIGTVVEIPLRGESIACMIGRDVKHVHRMTYVYVQR